MLFQMTISTSHTINGEGLCRALHVVGGSDPALYFVVPPYIFDEFKDKQPIKWSGKEQLGRVQSVRQFVMKVAI